MKTDKSTQGIDIKKMTVYALLIATAMIFSYVETLIPFPFFAPGMKLGLANLVTIVTLYKMGASHGAVISLVRICLSAMLFGNAFALAYSLAGGIFSLVVMILLKKSDKLGIAGVSIAGGVCHNIAQVAVAALLLETGEMVYYLPVLLLTGTVTGCLIGILGGMTLSKLTRR